MYTAFNLNKFICHQGILLWVRKIIFAAYIQSVHNKSFKSRLYIVFRQLFSSVFIKCKKPIVSSFELLFCCNYALLWQKIMIYFTRKMLQDYFVDFIVLQGEISRYRGEGWMVGCSWKLILSSKIDTCTLSSS